MGAGAEPARKRQRTGTPPEPPAAGTGPSPSPPPGLAPPDAEDLDSADDDYASMTDEEEDDGGIGDEDGELDDDLDDVSLQEVGFVRSAVPSRCAIGQNVFDACGWRQDRGVWGA